MNIYSITDVGLKRQVNQDYIYATEKEVGILPNIFLVADGMGGHKAGDYASKTTVENILLEIGHSKEEDAVASIRNAITATNQLLYRKSKENEDLSGMGTTAVVATCQGSVLLVANIGDSRLYIINRQSIRQITRDHSFVEEMVRVGSLDRESARKHPDKNIITRAVGVQSQVEVDFYKEKIEAGDIVLMCSDGLSNMLEDEKIQKIIIEGNSLEKKAKNLVQAANDNGGKDNISVILIELDAGGLL